MLIIFKNPGEYKNDDINAIVLKEDVKSEKVFTFCEKNAKSYIRAGHAELAEEIKEQKKPPAPITLDDVNKMTLPELRAHAHKNDIELGDATVKAEILEVIVKTFEKKED